MRSRCETGERRGLTLIELLVVLAILAMLMGILLPVLVRAKERSRRLHCLATVRQLSHAHLLYVQDYDEQLPPWSLQPSTAKGNTADWTTYLQPYLKCVRLLGDTDAPPPAVTQAGASYLADYTLLTWQKPGRRNIPSEPTERWPGPPMTLGQVARPSETIQWMDGRTAPGWTAGALWRHGEGLNAAFVDGHAKWMAARQFRRLEQDADGTFWLFYGAADR